MANQQHLNMLRQDIGIWNTWRKEHPETNPDLSDADLSGAHLNKADLSGAHLSGTNLTRAHLNDADLSGAHLSRACLTEAHLFHANLNDADLSRANLSKVHLWGAHLRGAYLTGAVFNKEADLQRADFTGAHLTGAHLSGTFLAGTNLTGADLSEADLSEASLHNANLRGTYLRGADLRGSFLIEADLSEASLIFADLRGANLRGANLRGANLRGANLSDTDLSDTNFSEADLSEAYLTRATLNGANLSRAILSKANLIEVILIRANLQEAILTDCFIYGISAWSTQLEKATQQNLCITPPEEAAITVDDLEVAQFIYLMLNNQKIRQVINTITSKAVLILGRFTPERKIVLDALREALRQQNYLPILFDFEGPSSRDLTETVSTLAHLARFIIVDLTDPSSAPHEVATVIPQTVVPVQPVILDSEREYSMFRDLRQRYHWVLPTYSYPDQAHLLATLQEHVIAPAEQKAQELEKR